jgi:hypothetical protein
MSQLDLIPLETMPMFDPDDMPDPALPISRHLADMHRQYGRLANGKTCGACIQFEHISRSRTSTTARCRLVHRSTDWAAKWPACGKFQVGGQYE